eukprot:COSAG02_NODE_4565_length_5213_cov_3.488268_4_plen_184_part_00
MLLLFACAVQAPFLIPRLPKPSKPWKTTHLTTYQVRCELLAHHPYFPSNPLSLALSLCSDPTWPYQSINPKECLWSENGSNPCGRHPVDATANTHTSIRITNSTTDLLYAEFVDVTDPKAWNFEANIAFFALFDMKLDPFQLRNVFSTSSPALKAELHAEMLRANHCRGQGGGDAVAGKSECP